MVAARSIGRDAMTGTLRRVVEAHFTFRRGVLALDLDFAVDDGEVLAVVGPNGAGKTTVLRVLAGLERIDSGRLVIDGRTVDQRHPEIHVDPADRCVGMLFQNRALFANMTALGNVAFGLRSRGASRASAESAAGSWLERMGVASVAATRVGRLSGGEAQRVAMARALAGGPRLLLLDEPLTAVDAGARPPLRDVLRSHLDDFAGGCVIVSHDPADVASIADRVIVIEDGAIAQSGTPAEILDAPKCGYARALAAGRTS